jgi:pyridoxal/pyridoxine/pyridoxamine kinase
MIIPIANSFNVFLNIRQGKTYSESDLRDICASVLRGKFSSFTQIITGYLHKIHLMKTVGGITARIRVVHDSKWQINLINFDD